MTGETRTVADLGERTLKESMRWVELLDERSRHYKTGVDPAKDKQVFTAPRRAVGRLCRIVLALTDFVEQTDEAAEGGFADTEAARHALRTLLDELK